MNARLSQLYSPGKKLSEVPPFFKGIPWRDWWLLEIGEQAEAWRTAYGRTDGQGDVQRDVPARRAVQGSRPEEAAGLFQQTGEVVIDREYGL